MNRRTLILFGLGAVVVATGAIANRSSEPGRSDTPAISTTTSTVETSAPATSTVLPGFDYDPTNFILEGTPLPESSASEPSGNFRTACHAGHLAYDDPIVHPGQPGASHLHQFFGNLGVNANSTHTSLLTSGNSTCDGGPINRSGYWIPALINTADDTVVVPTGIITYYKGESVSGVTELPPGLRMVAGYDMDTATVSNGGVSWQCESNGYAESATIGTCSGELIAVVRFPYCWDGRNLDSPDHRSHMADAGDNGWGACPASHPVVIPRISYHVYYDVVTSDILQLSSDVMPDMSHPGGRTLHGDWFGAWNPAFSDRWFEGCLQGLRNCNPGNPGTQLGDGGQLINAAPAAISGRPRVPSNN